MDRHCYNQERLQGKIKVGHQTLQIHIWQTPNQISSCDNHTLFWLEPGRQLRSGRKSTVSAAGRFTFFSYLCHTCCRANALASWNTWKPLVSPSINWVWQHGWVILGIRWKCYVTSIALRNVREYYYGPLTISAEITIWLPVLNKTTYSFVASFSQEKIHLLISCTLRWPYGDQQW